MLSSWALRTTAALFLLACTTAAAQSAETEASALAALRIGASVSRSGPLAAESQLVERGLKQWVEDLNDRGALLGRPVELILRDDRSSVAGAIASYEALLDAGVGLFISPYSSALTLAVRDALGDRDYAMIAVSSAPEIWSRPNPRIFGLYTPADDNMRPALELAQERGLARVAIAHLDSRFPRAVADGAERLAQYLGLDVVAKESYSNESTLRPMLSRIATTQPEVLLLGAYMSDSVALTQAAQTVNLKPKLVVFSGAPAVRDFGERLEYRGIDGILSTVQWMRSVRFPGAFDFGFRYRRQHGIYPSYDAAGGYAALQVMEAAVRLAQSTAPERVRQQLKTLKFRSILGHFRVDDRGRQIAKQTYLVQWQDRHISLVYPTDIARWDLRFPFSDW
ncbi:MAG: amino acid ABC transporter substrate-binding protein [Pseudomonadota bacterium]